jgi:group II intron reverse transcriptase/maturase
MERRGLQNPILTKNTPPAYNRGSKGQTMTAREVMSWQVRIGLKAQDKACVFTNLMKHINIDTLKEAFKSIDGKKALGVDEISKSEYGKNLEENLADLYKRVANGSYRPLPKREVLIPKSNGKMRPIAIASFEDKLVDWCVGAILDRVYEPLFIRNSFGYRRGKSQHDAVEAAYYSLEKGTRANVVEIDFSNFFNTIPHKKLVRILKRRIADERFIGLIYRLLTGEILKGTGETTPTHIGTPQGGIASPILANIYLNEVVDQWFLENYASYNNIIVRYADDAVFFFKGEDDAKDFMRALSTRVTEYGITINTVKSRMIRMGKQSHESFNFLGFTFYRGKQGSRNILKVKTQKERLIKAINEFYDWIKANRNRRKLSDLWALAKSKLMGHLNYYGYWMNNLKIHHFYSEAWKALFKWLNRRSQKRSYTAEGFNERIKNFPLMPAFENIKWKHLGRSFGYVGR